MQDLGKIWLQRNIYLELYIVKKYLINPYLNIEIVDIVAIVKHSVVVRIWQIIWRQLLKHLMVMVMRVSLVSLELR